MTTLTRFTSTEEVSTRPPFRAVTFSNGLHSQQPIAKNWSAPVLDLFPQIHPLPPAIPAIPKLYLVPTPNCFEGEEEDEDSQPIPTSLADLPRLDEWVEKYLVSTIEIWAGRRPIQQVSRWTHRKVYAELTRNVGQFKVPPKIRKLYIHEPIEGVGEITVTLRFGDRVRALTLRFEGVDKRWLCTQLNLL